MGRSASRPRAAVRLTPPGGPVTPQRSTIFAHSSGRPPAAIALIRLSGPEAHQAAQQLCGSLPPPRVAGLRTLSAQDGTLLDEVIVLRFDGPASATGEDVVEFHCHGGRAVIEAILGELGRAPGLRAALPGEFTRRALVNGRLDLTEAEGLADLLEAETESQRRAALMLTGGALRRQIEDWAVRLVMLSAQAEAAIDYVGDEDETAADPEQLAGAAALIGAEMGEWLRRPRAEPLKDGIRVVLAGPPNAGKSSLLNALVGQDRAIVTPIEGTTRDTIEVPVSIGGVPLVLVDTAGLRASDDAVERLGVERTRSEVRVADVLLWLGEPKHAPSAAARVIVHPRCDLPNRVVAPSGTLPVSAVSGAGLPELTLRLVELAQSLLPREGEVALNQRQANAIELASAALSAAPADLILVADNLRSARAALDRVTGRVGIEDVLDQLFRRFCLGK
ncbi:tRNA uridine-5-carboxymethylaminomethyl(34) synthesis GTPase MnmE [Sphingomonas sp. GCM10030256]|uniref:tRNA uridine-5-carboxymethylaminomethyl(34) synthesis GTPase MnmE n=1 Tax=Sphingomonas sp. GCM10030256 TaxID=3273427 RepID=UPI00360B6689